MKRRISRRTLLAVAGLMPIVALATVQPAFAAMARSDVSVTIFSNRPAVAVGQQIRYTAVMTNHGPDDAAFVDVNFRSSRLDVVSMTCDLGISADGSTCEYSSLKAGQTVVSVMVATPHPGQRGSRRISVAAQVLFENSCASDPNCTFDPNTANNAASVVTRLFGRPAHF